MTETIDQLKWKMDHSVIEPFLTGNTRMEWDDMKKQAGELEEKLIEVRELGDLLHMLLHQAKLYKGYGHGPLDAPAVGLTLTYWKDATGDKDENSER